MKLFMNKNEKYEEPEVHMFFHKQTKEVEQVEKFVRSLSITIPAKYKMYPIVGQFEFSKPLSSDPSFSENP